MEEQTNWIETPSFLPEYTPQNEKKKKIFRMIFFIFLLCAVLFSATLVSSFWFGAHAIIRSDAIHSKSLLTEEAIKPPSFLQKLQRLFIPNTSSLRGQKNNQVNILLLGMGGEGHDGPYLSDTIMVASIEPDSPSLTLLSIPRDLTVPIPGYGWRKINHANAFGEAQKQGDGAAYAATIISQVLDQPIHYYVRIDFSGFKQFIDDIGGIEVTVERSFTDYQFPTENYKQQTVQFEAGAQKMDGERALQFARSRYGTSGEGSDFARARRQQLVLQAVKQQLLSPTTIFNPARIKRMMNTLSTHLTTNIEIWEMSSLVKIGRTVSKDRIKTAVLDSSPEGLLRDAITSDGAYILQPKSGSFLEIQNFVKNLFASKEKNRESDDSPSHKKGNGKPIVEIQNGTWRSGLAARFRKKIEELYPNYIITEVGNAAHRPYDTTLIYDVSGGKREKEIKELQKQFHAVVSLSPPARAQEGNITSTDTQSLSPSVSVLNPETEILIIVGEDNVL